MSALTTSTKIVILSGAGISAESGLATFRDAGGLWEGHRPEDVATPQAWARDPALVLRFYRMRYEQLLTVEPNAAHRALVELERTHDVTIITQNVDDLHERAGSTRVVHLHGQLRYVRSEWVDPYDLDPMITRVEGAYPGVGDHAPDGGQLRPHVVWFGEPVPMIDRAAQIVEQADHCLVVGTSLQVYPAAGLTSYLPPQASLTYIDPRADDHRGSFSRPCQIITAPASVGVPHWVAEMKASLN